MQWALTLHPPTPYHAPFGAILAPEILGNPPTIRKGLRNARFISFIHRAGLQIQPPALAGVNRAAVRSAPARYCDGDCALSAGRDLTGDEIFAIKRMIESAGLCAVLQEVSILCGEKAESVRAFKLGEDVARCWDSASGIIGIASVDKVILAIGRPG